MSQEQVLNNINVKVGQLEVMQKNNTDAVKEMASSVSSLVVELKESNNIAREALEKSKSAHKRLDKVDKIIFWVATTIIGSIVVAVLATVIK